MKKFLLSTFLILFCFSCSSLNKSYINAPVNVSSTVEVDADITLGNEITGTANSTSLFGLLTLDGPTKFADNVFGGLPSAAAYNALEGTGADVIVNPQYTYSVEKVLFFTTTTCTVTGVEGFVSLKK